MAAEKPIRRRTDKLRRKFYRRIVNEWVDAYKNELKQAKLARFEEYKQKLKRYKEAELARKEARDDRAYLAAVRYLEGLKILDSYSGPGGNSRYQYATREEAQEARRKYTLAYGWVHGKLSRAKASQRNRDSQKRAGIIRHRRTDGIMDFYRNMLLAETLDCYYCRQPTPKSERTANHYIPLAKGGPHEVSNLVMACRDCNGAKSDMMPEEFLRSNRIKHLRNL